MKALLWLLLAGGQLWAQASFELQSRLPMPQADHFTADQFGNIYTVHRAELRKYDLRGEQLYSFSHPMLGDISQVDLFSPMRPHVFYRDANTLVVTDNRLNENYQLNFSEEGFYDLRFFALADQENIWFYDQARDRLFRYNLLQRRVSNQSLNLTQLLGMENQPQSLVSTLDRLYLNVPERGVVVFDALGTLDRIIPLKNLSSIDVSGNLLYALRDGQVLIYHLETGELLPTLFSEKNLRELRVQGNRLYLYDGKQLSLYQRK